MTHFGSFLVPIPLHWGEGAARPKHLSKKEGYGVVWIKWGLDLGSTHLCTHIYKESPIKWFQKVVNLEGVWIWVLEV